MNIEKYKRSQIFSKFILILGWLSAWFSLSFYPENLTNNFFDLDIYQQINYLRGLSSLIFFPIILLIFLIFTYKDKIFKKSNLIHNLLILFFSIQLVGLLFNKNPNINFYYSITSINIVLITFIFKNYFSEYDINNLLKISILILLVIFIYFSFNYIKESIIFNTNLYKVWGKLDLDNVSNFYDSPKPTGLSRTAFIILMFFIVISFKDKNNFWISLITVLTISMIILLSSRLVIFNLLIFIFFYLFYFQIFREKKIISFCKNFILYPILLIFLFNTFLNLNSNSKINNDELKINIFENKLKRNFPKFEEKYNKDVLEYFSSGRSKDWQDILQKNNNIIIGNGVMGDRFLINQSASNLIIYSYASSGLIGTILISIVCLKIFIDTINSISQRKKILETPYMLVSCLIIIFLLLRSVLETSFGVFGIDLLLFCLSTAIITKESKV